MPRQQRLSKELMTASFAVTSLYSWLHWSSVIKETPDCYEIAEQVSVSAQRSHKPWLNQYLWIYSVPTGTVSGSWLLRHDRRSSNFSDSAAATTVTHLQPNRRSSTVHEPDCELRLGAIRHLFRHYQKFYVFLNRALWYTYVIRTNKMHTFFINDLI